MGGAGRERLLAQFSITRNVAETQRLTPACSAAGTEDEFVVRLERRALRGILVGEIR